jgi:hypothetical protein
MAKYSVDVTRTTVETTTLELEGDDDTDWDAVVQAHLAATPDSQVAWSLEDITYDIDDTTEIDPDDPDEGQ